MQEVLRQAIAKSGKSVNQIAKDSGVLQQALSKFMRGGDIRLATAQKLADYFGLALKEDRPKKN
jgi:transcriptional regulator with XRE-family HTH domain